jgi:hypothetical protein
MSSRDVAPSAQWQEPQSGARVASTLFIIESAPNVYSPSDTGPPDAYQDLVTANYEVNTSANEHEGFAKIINGVGVSR